MNLDEDGYTQTWNHKKTFQKTQKTTTYWLKK